MKYLFYVTCVLGILSCGSGDNSAQFDTTNVTQIDSGENGSGAILTEDLTASPGDVVRILGAGSTSKHAIYRWTLIGDFPIGFLKPDGTAVEAPDSRDLLVHIPASYAGESFSLQLDIDDGGTRDNSEVITINVTPCVDKDTYIFVDCIDPSWKGIASEERINMEEVQTFYTGEGERHVNWSVLNLLDDEHNQVLDIQFRKENSAGAIFISSREMAYVSTSATSGGNFSTYSRDSLHFDMRVLDAAGNDTIFLEGECQTPCVGPRLQLPIDTSGQWFTQKVYSHMIEFLGRDFSNLTSAFKISPGSLQQQGFHIQVDNIRFYTDICDSVAGQVFRDCFDPTWFRPGTWDSEGTLIIGSGLNDPTFGEHVFWELVFPGDPERSDVLQLSFVKPGVYGGFFTEALNFNTSVSNYSDGDFVFDFRLISPSSENAAVYYNCGPDCEGIKNVISFGEPGVWQEVRIPVRTLEAQGMNINDVRRGINIFPSDSKAQDGLVFQLDNIRFEN
ncbi:hypothetical protein [Teredinibacter sp. KSP-S5-2]|uniref:hypothetical protein n=1 Tax=Teredinibacter sp. KSP-S5-2 TaxID=3034506 RepID=UPI00293466F1|nr:hypothetical protein [Teredinibacter sp. KSP-S5-2]WNO10809.1 hypothetical protein P5V12_06425 [Teredinibacter sp. KSP-S5-2]